MSQFIPGTKLGRFFLYSSLAVATLTIILPLLPSKSSNINILNNNKITMNPTHYTAIVLGATGATGSQIVKHLIKSSKCDQVTAIIRQSSEPYNYNLTEDEQKKLNILAIDFENLPQYIDQFPSNSIVFSALGSTRAQAGTIEKFYNIDHNYQVNLAKLLLNKKNCTQFHLVSTAGANAQSWFAYLRIKGEIENSLAKLHYPRLSIYRPGLLITERKETRIPEKIAQTILPKIESILDFIRLPQYISASVSTVAAAMVKNAESVPSKQNCAYYNEQTSSNYIELFENKAIVTMSLESEKQMPPTMNPNDQ